MDYRYGLGDAAAGNRRMIVRNLARLVGYAAAIPLVLVGGAVGIAVLGLGACLYVWLPVARVWRRRLSPTVVVGIPVELAVKEVAKALV